MKADALRTFFAGFSKEKAPLAGGAQQKECDMTLLHEPTAPSNTASQRRLPLHFGNSSSYRITPDLAERILVECNYERQRAVRRLNVQVLASQMHRGDWTAGSQLSFARLDGRCILINGQHRLNAVVKAGVEIDFSIQVTDVASEEEVAVLYFRHDVVMGVRTVQDVLTAANVCHDRGLTKRQASHLAAAVKLIESGLTVSSANVEPELRAPDRLLEKMVPWYPAAREFYSAIGGARATMRLLERRPVMASALMTFRYEPVLAGVFWGGAAQDDGLRKTDPRKALLTFLGANIGKLNSGVALIRGCSLCWNAFIRDDTLTTVKAGMDAPIVFLKTPIGKKAR